MIIKSKVSVTGIIGVCWASGALVGFLPLMGWHRGGNGEVKCYFTEVMDYSYLVFLYFGTIIIPAAIMAAFYAHIYRVVLKQVRRIVTMNPAGSGPSITGDGTMLRVLGVARKREVKATQNLSIIVLFFIICWIPLYTINCVQAFCQDCEIYNSLTLFCVILSHANSAINPLLYAYHLRDFQAALKNLICCLLGVSSDEEVNIRGRIFSQMGLHTPTRNNSIQSIHQSRFQHSTVYTESTTVCARSSPAHKAVVNTIMSSMSDIGSLPLGEDQRRRMWTLTEVPSTSEDDARTSVELRGENRGRKKSESEWSSGQVNSAYIGEGIALDYDEDDDVFIPEQISTLNVVDLKSHSWTSGCFNDISKSQNSNVNSQIELYTRHSRPKSLQEVSSRIGVVESTFDNQCESPLILEIEKNNVAVDENEKTELAKSDFTKKTNIVAIDDSRICRDRTMNIELVNNNSKELIKSNASQNNQKLSPLKIVGEFLFPNSHKKLISVKDESLVDSCKSETSLLEGNDAAIENKDDRNVSKTCP
ncbi:hypothetical protein L9F63_016753, partial [Diploptera punctata]